MSPIFVARFIRSSVSTAVLYDSEFRKDIDKKIMVQKLFVARNKIVLEA